MTDYRTDQPELRLDGRRPHWDRQRPSWWRGVFFIALGLLALAFVIWLVWPGSGAGQKTGFGTGGPIPVGVARVATGDVRVTLDGLGTVTPLATVTVHPQVTGYLKRFDIVEGQMVKPGQVLAEIDPRPFQAAYDQAKGQMARDAATLANAKIDLGRYQALWKQNAISQQLLQTQIGTVNSDTGTVEADKAAVEAAKVNLDFCRVTSPVGGRVGLRQVDAGNLVVSGGATALIVVTQLQPISVLFSLPEDNINRVMDQVGAGQKLAVTAFDRSGTTRLADGLLSNVDNQVDATTGMVKMRAMFDNPGNALFPSQFVNVRVLIETLHNQAFMPAAALQHGADGAYVYVIDHGRVARMRAVQTGPTDGDRIAVTGGLNPGDVVVVDGADRLKDGAKVTIPAGNPAGQAQGGWTGSHAGQHRHHRQRGADGGGPGGAP
jgi:multidrug efflux system membrane fusion protein